MEQDRTKKLWPFQMSIYLCDEDGLHGIFWLLHMDPCPSAHHVCSVCWDLLHHPDKAKSRYNQPERGRSFLWTGVQDSQISSTCSLPVCNIVAASVHFKLCFLFLPWVSHPPIFDVLGNTVIPCQFCHEPHCLCLQDKEVQNHVPFNFKDLYPVQKTRPSSYRANNRPTVINKEQMLTWQYIPDHW